MDALVIVMGILIPVLLAGCIWFHADNLEMRRKVTRAEADVQAYREVAIRLQEKAEKKMRMLESELAWWKRQVKGHQYKQTNNQVVIKSPFNEDQLKTLINLCHPDRHGGKQSAVEITQILLSLRNR